MDCAPFYFQKYLNLDDKLYEHLNLDNQAVQCLYEKKVLMQEIYLQHTASELSTAHSVKYALTLVDLSGERGLLGFTPRSFTFLCFDSCLTIMSIRMLSAVVTKYPTHGVPRMAQRK